MNVRTCRAVECRAEFVYLKTVKGKFEPVDVGSLSSLDRKLLAAGEELPFDRSRHVSHFITCKDSKRFRKGKETR